MKAILLLHILVQSGSSWVTVDRQYSFQQIPMPSMEACEREKAKVAADMRGNVRASCIAVE